MGWFLRLGREELRQSPVSVSFWHEGKSPTSLRHLQLCACRNQRAQSCGPGALPGSWAAQGGCKWSPGIPPGLAEPHCVRRGGHRA